MSDAILLLSAGLDSTVSLALAREAGLEIKQALCFDYGQRAAVREIERSQQLAHYYQIPLKLIELPWLAAITHTALSQHSAIDVPEVAMEVLDQVSGVTLESAQKVWVPNRNGLFVNVAGAYADSFGYARILVGFNAEEAATFPDNTPQFAKAITHSLAFSTAVQPKVESYVQHLNKIEIFHEAMRLQVPVKWLWSCYHAGEKHCGRCESCNRLKRAAIASGHAGAVSELFEAGEV